MPCGDRAAVGEGCRKEASRGHGSTSPLASDVLPGDLSHAARTSPVPCGERGNYGRAAETPRPTTVRDLPRAATPSTPPNARTPPIPTSVLTPPTSTPAATPVPCGERAAAGEGCSKEASRGHGSTSPLASDVLPGDLTHAARTSPVPCGERAAAGGDCGRAAEPQGCLAHKKQPTSLGPRFPQSPPGATTARAATPPTPPNAKVSVAETEMVACTPPTPNRAATPPTPPNARTPPMPSRVPTPPTPLTG